MKQQNIEPTPVNTGPWKWFKDWFRPSAGFNPEKPAPTPIEFGEVTVNVSHPELFYALTREYGTGLHDVEVNNYYDWEHWELGGLRNEFIDTGFTYFTNSASPYDWALGLSTRMNLSTKASNFGYYNDSKLAKVKNELEKLGLSSEVSVITEARHKDHDYERDPRYDELGLSIKFEKHYFCKLETGIRSWDRRWERYRDTCDHPNNSEPRNNTLELRFCYSGRQWDALNEESYKLFLDSYASILRRVLLALYLVEGKSFPDINITLEPSELYKKVEEVRRKRLKDVFSVEELKGLEEVRQNLTQIREKERAEHAIPESFIKANLDLG